MTSVSRSAWLLRSSCTQVAGTTATLPCKLNSIVACDRLSVSHLCDLFHVSLGLGQRSHHCREHVTRKLHRFGQRVPPLRGNERRRASRNARRSRHSTRRNPNLSRRHLTCTYPCRLATSSRRCRLRSSKFALAAAAAAAAAAVTGLPPLLRSRSILPCPPGRSRDEGAGVLCFCAGCQQKRNRVWDNFRALRAWCDSWWWPLVRIAVARLGGDCVTCGRPSWVLACLLTRAFSRQSAHRGHRNDVNINMSFRKGLPTNWLTGQTSAKRHMTQRWPALG